MIRRGIALAAALAGLVGVIPLLGTQTLAAPIAIGRVHSSFQPRSGKVFVLVIGNDARAGNPDSARADAIHLVGINTKTMKGGILNFPRDSWVSIPGRSSAKINEALLAGGPDALARTIEGLTGIHIDYWAMVGFEGFVNIMEALGGVRMHIPTDVYDPSGSGARIQAGTQNLYGGEALAYVRTRHSFAGGDFARTTNQGRFLLALLRKLRRQVGDGPSALLRWIAIAREHARFDVTPEELFRLGVLASQVRPKDVGNVTVPGSAGAAGAASVVYISDSAKQIYERFRAKGSL